jgi:hypothetical protein
MAFREIQHMRHSWVMPFIALIMGGVSLLFVWGSVQQLVLGRTFGNQPMPDTGLLLFSLGTIAFSAAMVYLIWISRQELRVDEQGIRIRFAPWTGERRIPWEQVETWSMGQYHPLWDFGGLGVHWTRKGQAYAVKGREGLALACNGRRRGDRRFLIGTQDPRGLREAMERLAPKGSFRAAE